MTGIASDGGNEPITLDDFLDDGDAGAADDNQSLDDTAADAATAAEAGDEDLDLIDGIDDDADGQQQVEESATPAVAMPNSWSKDDAKEWAELPAAAQEIIARREGERDKYLREVGFKASQTRQQVEGQAREVIAKLHENHATALQVYAQRFTPQEPDQRLLYTGNPDDVLIYQRQDANFRAAQAQQHQLQQEIAQAQSFAEHARGQTQQAELASDAQRLQEQLPEWFDPSEGPKLQQALQSIGAELGYPAELMAQASSTDIIALKTASEWKAKAAKYDAIMAKKMEGVRAAKELPRMARPGTKPTRGQQEAATTSRREQALERFGQSRSGDAAAALLLQRTR